MDTYVSLAVSDLISLDKKVSLKKSINGEVAYDNSEYLVNHARHKTELLKVDIHKKDWVKSAHSELKKMGDAQITAIQELYGNNQ